MVLLGGSDDEFDSVSLDTSECKEWVNSGDDFAPLPPKETDDV